MSDSVVHPYANENDQGPSITVAAIFCMTIMVLAFGTRLWIRSPLAALFSHDDWVTAAASVVATAQSILILVAVGDGLGQRIENGTAQSQAVLTMTYAGAILYVGSLYLGKMAVVLLVMRLCKSKQHRHISAALLIAMSCWGVASLIAIAAPYSATEPFEDTSNALSRWSSIEALGLVLEGLILAFITHIVWGLRASVETKLSVLAGFYFRAALFVIVPFRLYFISAARVSANTSITFMATMPEVLTQLEMHVNIITATVPCLRIFLNHFYSGYLGGLGLDAPDLYYSRTGGSVSQTVGSGRQGSVATQAKAITVHTSTEMQVLDRAGFAPPWGRRERERGKSWASDASNNPLRPGTTTTIVGPGSE